MNRFQHELEIRRSGSRRIAGVDEAGRGPLAGPVVAAAVVFPSDWVDGALPDELAELNDSKQLSERRRDAFFEFITGHSEIEWAMGECSAEVIDAQNILKATHRAMRLAVQALRVLPEHVLVDGRPVADLGVPHTAIVKGDARSYSIAAASVLAKVYRDRAMVRWDALYPQYGFAAHKGYGTRQHREAISENGPCPLHRMTFAPLKATQPDLF